MTAPPAMPAFTSTPPTAAEEGTTYTYTLMGTAPDGSAVNFVLTSGPVGATLEANTVSWTPTHAESRLANAFTVTATTAKGGSATQNWSVTPNGTVNITAVTTYWGPNGNVDVLPGWPSAGYQYFAVQIPQADGSLVSLTGTQNPDGSYSVPNVPAGYYWLELSPFIPFWATDSPMNFYWTSTSDFDGGQNVIGKQNISLSVETTTTFDYTISGLLPSPPGDDVQVRGDAVGMPFILTDVQSVGASNSISSSITQQSPMDWSQIDTLYFLQYETLNSRGFQGEMLGPETTQTNVSLVNGGTNSLTATPIASPPGSMELSIRGSAWAAAMQGVGPGAPSPIFSNFDLGAEPYLTNEFMGESAVSPTLGSISLLHPTGSLFEIAQALICENAQFPPPGFPYTAPITSDVEYGTLSYGDPFPASWPRLFQYCQASNVFLPRPNSSLVDVFTVVNKQTTGIPTGAVSPLMTAVQNPTLNGESMFSGGILPTASVNLSWEPPGTGKPFGYYVTAYQLRTFPQPPGNGGYSLFARYGTAKTSMRVPFLVSGETYVFLISAEMDANANMETSPFRARIPAAESSVISAPYVILPQQAGK